MRYLKTNRPVYVLWLVYSLFLTDLSYYLNMYAVVMKRGPLYAAFFLAVVLISLASARLTWRDRSISVRSALLWALFSVLISFLFFGKPLLYTADGLWLTGMHLPGFGLLTVLIGIYILLSLDALKRLKADAIRPLDGPEARNVFLHGFILFVFQIVVFSVYLAALNPGNMSYDTYNQVSQITGLAPYNTWHPIGHTLFIGVLLKVWPNMAMVAVFQILFFALVTCRFYSTLIRNRVALPLVYALALVITLQPATGLHVVTLWKDIPYTAALLWGTNILLLMCLSTDYLAKKRHGLEFAVCTLAIGLFRHNGILAFILMLVWGLVHIVRSGDRQQRINFGAAAVLVLAVFMLVNGLIPARLAANPNPPGMKLRPVYQGLGAVYYAGREAGLDARTRQMVQSVATPEELKEFYDPYFADIYSSNIPQFLNNLSAISTEEALSAYLGALRKFPAIIIGDKFNLAVTLWSVSQDPFSYNNNYTTAIEPEMQSVFQVRRHENVLTAGVNWYAWATTGQYLTNTFLWRTGFWLALLFILLLDLLLARDRRVLLYLPAAGNALAVFLTMPAQDYRYLWFIALICPFLLFSALLPLSEKATVD
ncbi:MAG: hypothetical protein RBT41_01640 [Clostridia bacterium]|jgi:hypothetical protein|nr:hypothetical protein [Clostridia bacterium]